MPGRFFGNFQDGPIADQFGQPSEPLLSFTAAEEAKSIFADHNHRQIWSGRFGDSLADGPVALSERGQCIRVQNHTGQSSGSMRSNSASITFWMRRVSARSTR